MSLSLHDNGKLNESLHFLQSGQNACFEESYRSELIAVGRKKPRIDWKKAIAIVTFLVIGSIGLWISLTVKGPGQTSASNDLIGESARNEDIIRAIRPL